MQYLKEPAVAISKLDFSWARRAFKHCVTPALNDLALSDMGEGK